MKYKFEERVTENEIRSRIQALTQLLANGEITVAEAHELNELRNDLAYIENTKTGKAF